MNGQSREVREWRCLPESVVGVPGTKKKSDFME